MDNPSAPTPKPYAEALERFRQDDAKNGRKSADTVFFGSSSIEFWTSLETDFKGDNALNRGIGGSELSELDLDLKELVEDYHPKKAVLYAGTNDLAAGHSGEQVFQDFVKLEKDLHKALPDTDLYFISMNIPPSREKLRSEYEYANGKIKDYCDHVAHTRYIDIMPLMLDTSGKLKPQLFRDGLHMTKEGYALWQPAIEKELHTPEVDE